MNEPSYQERNSFEIDEDFTTLKVKTANGEEHVNFCVYDSVKEGEKGERFVIFASPEGIEDMRGSKNWAGMVVLTQFFLFLTKLSLLGDDSWKIKRY